MNKRGNNMETKIIKMDEENIDREGIGLAADLIRRGELVSFPTETVYGLGANGLDQEAVEKIYEAKGRPSDNPLILHIAHRDQLEDLVREIPQEAVKCMDNFWPGPLTIIFKKSDLVPDIITAGLDTVAIRMPDNQIARSLIREADRPIAAPSANTSGRPSPTQADHVKEDLEGRLPLIIDGGPTGVGLESTVIDLTSDLPTILRPGGITPEDFIRVLGRVELDPSIVSLDENIIPKSPGQKYRHYAPQGDMYIYRGDLDQVVEAIRARTRDLVGAGQQVGIICTDESRASYDQGLVKSLGSRRDEASIARNLFATLREMDQEGVDVILAEAVDFLDMGIAIMNRMIKASGGKIIEL